MNSHVSRAGLRHCFPHSHSCRVDEPHWDAPVLAPPARNFSLLRGTDSPAVFRTIRFVTGGREMKGKEMVGSKGDDKKDPLTHYHPKFLVSFPSLKVLCIHYVSCFSATLDQCDMPHMVPRTPFI